MRPVKFDSVETGVTSAAGRGNEGTDHLVHFVVRHRTRTRFGIIRGAHRIGASDLARGPVAGVVQLHDRDTARHLDVAGESCEAGDVRIVVDAQLTGESDTDGLNRGGARHGQAETAEGAHREPAVLVVGEGAVRVALLVRQRSEHQPVRHRRSMGKSDGPEDVAVRYLRRCSVHPRDTLGPSLAFTVP